MKRRDKDRLATERTFLEDICRARDSDGPRLIFADWLEETGREEWARFIRLQCERAGLAPWERSAHELLRREKEVGDASEKALYRYRVVGLKTRSPERGFPASVFSPRGLPALHAGAEKLFTTIPIEEGII